MTAHVVIYSDGYRCTNMQILKVIRVHSLLATAPSLHVHVRYGYMAVHHLP